MASYQKSYEASNQATSCQYPLLLAKTRNLRSNNLHLVGPMKKKIIGDGQTKALTLVNHKAFIKMIDLENQRKRLVSIKLEKDQRDILLLCGAEYNSKAFGYRANMF